MTRITGKTDIQYQKFKQLGDGTLQEVQLDPRNIKRDLPKIKEVLADKKLALVFDDNKYYFLTDRTINNLMSGEIDENAVVSYGDGVHTGVYESDAEWVSFASVSNNVKLIEIKSRVRHNAKSKPAGAFFKYLNKTHFDFSRYGVFKLHERNYDDNCFVLALKAGGMSEEKLNSIRADCRDRIIPRIQIKNTICPKYNIVISVKTMRKDCDNTYRKYYHPDTTISESTKPNPTDEYYDIGLVDEHYFLIEKTNVTSFALENYDLVLTILTHLYNLNKMTLIGILIIYSLYLLIFNF